MKNITVEARIHGRKGSKILALTQAQLIL